MACEASSIPDKDRADRFTPRTTPRLSVKVTPMGAPSIRMIALSEARWSFREGPASLAVSRMWFSLSNVAMLRAEIWLKFSK